MVDRRRRDRYAELLRHFAAGLITNREYEIRWDQIIGPRTSQQEDPVLWPLFDQVWFCYDDLHTHRLKGRYRLGAKNRRTMAHFILFLYSDCEYEWPMKRFITWSSILGILTFGLWEVVWYLVWGWRARRKLEAMGDLDLWPFLRREDYEAALVHPRLLRGSAS